jgi:site-specific DNA recombinase
MMLDGDISASEFREIKAQFQPEIDKLSRKVIEVSSLDANYKRYLDWGFSLLKHFANQYERANLDAKKTNWFDFS